MKLLSSSENGRLIIQKENIISKLFNLIRQNENDLIKETEIVSVLRHICDSFAKQRLIFKEEEKNTIFRLVLHSTCNSIRQDATIICIHVILSMNLECVPISLLEMMTTVLNSPKSDMIKSCYTPKTFFEMNQFVKKLQIGMNFSCEI